MKTYKPSSELHRCAEEILNNQTRLIKYYEKQDRIHAEFIPCGNECDVELTRKVWIRRVVK